MLTVGKYTVCFIGPVGVPVVRHLNLLRAELSFDGVVLRYVTRGESKVRDTLYESGVLIAQDWQNVHGSFEQNGAGSWEAISARSLDDLKVANIVYRQW